MGGGGPTRSESPTNDLLGGEMSPRTSERKRTDISPSLWAIASVDWRTTNKYYSSRPPGYYRNYESLVGPASQANGTQRHLYAL